jgi:hypothetical protein
MSLLPGQSSLFEEDPMLAALHAQAVSCANLGSKMYHTLFTELADDYEAGGRIYALLAGRSARPIHDAIPLRLAGAIHRVVLRGDDSRLARHYPSVGGKPGEDFGADFIGYIRDHLDEVELGLSSQVQTNEVGRSVVHLVLSHWLTKFDIEEFDFLEVGASAGLNLNFDKFYGCFGQLRMGDATSALRFMGDWFDNAPLVSKTGARVVQRRGVDISPIDVSDPAQELRLLSFIWPDQKARLQRIRAAIDIAKSNKPLVDSESADTWIERQLRTRHERATVVFHSIVWQYLGPDVQRRFRQALEDTALAATPEKPLIWARMEPAGKVADVRVTMWRGEEPEEFLLAEIGYHGQDMKWLLPY